MYYYEGYNCPICQQPFNEQDDIVVCPQCGLPHHRACWSKEGHCHLHHLHGTDEQWSRERASSAQNERQNGNDRARSYRACPRCQTQNPEFAEFCQHCGTALNGDDNWHSNTVHHTAYSEYQPFRNANQTSQDVDPNEIIDDVKAEDLSAFVGAKANYYMPRFRRMARNGSSVSWNWAAFIFGPLWLLYRKMYAFGAIVLALELLHTMIINISFKALGLMSLDQIDYLDFISQLEATGTNSSSMYFSLAILIMSTIMIAVEIGLALFGNRLYRDHCQRKIANARAKTPDLTSGELSSIGGVSIAVTIIGYIAQYFISQILIMFI